MLWQRRNGQSHSKRMLLISAKKSIRLDTTVLVDDQLGIGQEVQIWSNEQMFYAQSMICPGEWEAQTSPSFWDTNGSCNLGQTTRPSDNQQKKRNCQIVGFAIPADHRVKLKESEKKDKYLGIARKPKKIMKHENDSDTNCNWHTRYSHQRTCTGTGGLGK